MATVHPPIKQTRVRASEKAVTVALKALQNAGLSVDRLCISGGQIEIHCGSVEATVATKKDGGLKDW